jgi:hypothetical protein
VRAAWQIAHLIYPPTEAHDMNLISSWWGSRFPQDIRGIQIWHSVRSARQSQMSRYRLISFFILMAPKLTFANSA